MSKSDGFEPPPLDRARSMASVNVSGTRDEGSNGGGSGSAGQSANPSRLHSATPSRRASMASLSRVPSMPPVVLTSASTLRADGSEGDYWGQQRSSASSQSLAAIISADSQSATANPAQEPAADGPADLMNRTSRRRMRPPIRSWKQTKADTSDAESNLALLASRYRQGSMSYPTTGSTDGSELRASPTNSDNGREDSEDVSGTTDEESSNSSSRGQTSKLSHRLRDLVTANLHRKHKSGQNVDVTNASSTNDTTSNGTGAAANGHTSTAREGSDGENRVLPPPSLGGPTRESRDSRRSSDLRSRRSSILTSSQPLAQSLMNGHSNETLQVDGSPLRLQLNGNSMDGVSITRLPSKSVLPPRERGSSAGSGGPSSSSTNSTANHPTLSPSPLLSSSSGGSGGAASSPSTSITNSGPPLSLQSDSPSSGRSSFRHGSSSMKSPMSAGGRRASMFVGSTSRDGSTTAPTSGRERPEGMPLFLRKHSEPRGYIDGSGGAGGSSGSGSLARDRAMSSAAMLGTSPTAPSSVHPEGGSGSTSSSARQSSSASWAQEIAGLRNHLNQQSSNVDAHIANIESTLSSADMTSIRLRLEQLEESQKARKAETDSKLQRLETELQNMKQLQRATLKTVYEALNAQTHPPVARRPDESFRMKLTNAFYVLLTWFGLGLATLSQPLQAIYPYVKPLTCCRRFVKSVRGIAGQARIIGSSGSSAASSGSGSGVGENGMDGSSNTSGSGGSLTNGNGAATSASPFTTTSLHQPFLPSSLHSHAHDHRHTGSSGGGRTLRPDRHSISASASFAGSSGLSMDRASGVSSRSSPQFHTLSGPLGASKHHRRAYTHTHSSRAASTNGSGTAPVIMERDHEEEEEDETPPHRTTATAPPMTSDDDEEEDAFNVDRDVRSRSILRSSDENGSSRDPIDRDRESLDGVAAVDGRSISPALSDRSGGSHHHHHRPYDVSSRYGGDEWNDGSGSGIGYSSSSSSLYRIGSRQRATPGHVHPSSRSSPQKSVLHERSKATIASLRQAGKKLKSASKRQQMER